MTPIQPLQMSLNAAICDNVDILRRFFWILKDPNQSLVCRFWHEVNSSAETYRLILVVYNQQKFMTRFTTKLPLQSAEAYFIRVKQIFFDVQELVQVAEIEYDVKQAREKGLVSLDLYPVMKMLEEAALIVLFKNLKRIPEVKELLNSDDFSLDAKTIRQWMQDNPEKLLTVENLDLRKLGIVVLPPEIGLLTNLQTLNLSSNKLSELPPDIYRLSNLIELDISGNPFKELPLDICLLSSLQKLDLHDIQLTELPSQIGNLTHLEWLCITGNNLTKLPPEIGQLIKLKILYLLHNQLTMLPPEIGQLTNLIWLYLSNNQLTKLPSTIGLLNNLTELGISNNQLTELPSEIGNLISVEWIDLSYNQLTALPPDIIQQINLENFMVLNLKNNKLTKLPLDLQTLSVRGKLKCEGNPVCDLPKEEWFSDTESPV